tara:strand:+ start:598 stop:2076 length:1479 start_codon:yes stop_codon:yes gene_type:complete
MNKKKFIDRKLNPSLANLVNTVNPFSAFGMIPKSLDDFEMNSQSLDLLKKEVEASAATLGDDEKVAKSDQELYERLINSETDLKNLRLVLRGISRETKISPGIKGFGEKIGAQYGLHMDQDGKYYLGVFSGLARNMSERIPQFSQKIWTYLLRFVYIGLFFLIGDYLGFYLVVTYFALYFALYWAMVVSPPLTDNAEPLAVFHLNTPMRDEIAGAIESALLQDGSFDGKLIEIEAELQKISSIFNTKDLTDARNVSLFVTNWVNTANYSNTISEPFYGSVTKMAKYLEKFFSTGDIGALEFAKSELNPIENKIGYTNLKRASWAPTTKLDFDANGPDGFRAKYNNSVDLSVADHVNDFRQALEDGDYYLASYYYGCDLTDTEQKQIKENNERILAERKAAEERRIAEAAQAQAAQAQAAQAPPPEKGSGFLSSVGKNVAAGAALGKVLGGGNTSGMVQATCRKCNHYETRPKGNHKAKCPKCGAFGFHWNNV